MTQQEFIDYCKKNKTVAFGVPAIIFILLLDGLVLKPSRQRKLDEARGVTSQSAPAVAPTAIGSSADAAVGKAPLTAPSPLESVHYPALSNRIDSRFIASERYPHDAGRNVFVKTQEQRVQVVTTAEPETENYERPEISYHGFFTLGNDRVAILRYADELLLTRVGGALKRSPFFLRSVFPERIIISDSSDSIREFEIALSEKPEETP